MAAHIQLKLMRRNIWPGGVRAHVLWNGQIDAASGDGKPGADPAASVDEQAPLTPKAIELWPVGKAGFGSGPLGRGPFGRDANWHPGYGFGREVLGRSEFGYYGDYLIWSTASVLPALRDGAYKFALRFEDRLGTVQTDPLREVTVNVQGVPRAPRNLRFVEFSEGQLLLAWDHSWDLIDVA